MVTSATVRIVRRMGICAGSVSAIEKSTNRVTSDFAKKIKWAVGITDAILIDIELVKNELTE